MGDYPHVCLCTVGFTSWCWQLWTDVWALGAQVIRRSINPNVIRRRCSNHCHFCLQICGCDNKTTLFKPLVAERFLGYLSHNSVLEPYVPILWSNWWKIQVSDGWLCTKSQWGALGPMEMCFLLLISLLKDRPHCVALAGSGLPMWTEWVLNPTSPQSAR